jgi:hypothetical protein
MIFLKIKAIRHVDHDIIKPIATPLKYILPVIIEIKRNMILKIKNSIIREVRRCFSRIFSLHSDNP